MANEAVCDLPDVVDGMCCTQVAAGFLHTVLLRSDGSAVACGLSLYGQCDLPVVDDAGVLQPGRRRGALHSASAQRR